MDARQPIPERNRLAANVASRPLTTVPRHAGESFGSLTISAEPRFDAQGRRLTAIEINDAIAMRQMALLAAMNNAAVLLNSRCEVVHVNHVALSLFDEDLTFRDGRLTASDRDSNNRLQQLICGAISEPSTYSTDAPCAIILVRRNRRPLLASVLLVHRRPESDDRDYAILLLTDPEHRPSPDQAILRGAFGLTAAEARLGYHLAVGASLDSAATKFGLTRCMVTKQLKSILLKTDTQRHEDLVILLTELMHYG